MLLFFLVVACISSCYTFLVNLFYFIFFLLIELESDHFFKFYFYVYFLNLSFIKKKKKDFQFRIFNTFLLLNLQIYDFEKKKHMSLYSF